MWSLVLRPPRTNFPNTRGLLQYRAYLGLLLVQHDTDNDSHISCWWAPKELLGLRFHFQIWFQFTRVFPCSIGPSPNWGILHATTVPHSKLGTFLISLLFQHLFSWQTQDSMLWDCAVLSCNRIPVYTTLLQRKLHSHSLNPQPRAPSHYSPKKNCLTLFDSGWSARRILRHLQSRSGLL